MVIESEQFSAYSPGAISASFSESRRGRALTLPLSDRLASRRALPTRGRCNSTNLIAENSRGTKKTVHLLGGVDIATCTGEYDVDTWIRRRTRCPPNRIPRRRRGLL